MRALTLIEPWAWCIAHAGKRYEHRTWQPWQSIVGKRIAIHAGKTYDERAARMIEAHIPSLVVPRDPPRGIVAVAKVTGFIHRDRTENDDVWFGGGLAWVLRDVRALDPIPCRGAQGLWEVPPDVLAEINRQLGGAP